jgi:Bacterial Ig-like domain
MTAPIELTTGNDTVVSSSPDLVVNGTALTLNNGDQLTADGSGTLALYGSGTFRVDQLATFSGFSNVTPNGTGTVTFTFSEAPTDFSLTHTSANGGSLANLVMVDATHYTATFTAAPGTDIITGSVSVDSTWYEANGNLGTGATSAAFVVDTVAPSRQVCWPFMP